MNATEDYLDRLLRSVTGEPEPEPEIEAEAYLNEALSNESAQDTESTSNLIDELNINIPDVEDIDLDYVPDFSDEPVSAVSDLPSFSDMLAMDEAAEITGVSVAEDALEAAEVPVVEDISEIPDISDLGSLDDIPEIADIPVVEEIGDMPVLEDIPEISDVDSGASDLPSFSDMLAMDDAAIADEIPLENLKPDMPEEVVEEEIPVVEDIPEISIEEPVLEDIPAVEDIPVVEEIPEVVIEEPVLEDIPVVEEISDIPAIEDIPVVEAIPEIAIEEPVLEDIPVVEEIPDIPEITIEEPAIEEPVLEEIPEISDLPELEGINLDEIGDLPALDDIPEIADVPVEEPVAEEIPEISIEEPIPEEVPEEIPEAAPAEPANMQDDEIANLLKDIESMEQNGLFSDAGEEEQAPAPEPAIEEPSLEELSFDDLSITEQAAEEPTAEEPVSAEPVATDEPLFGETAEALFDETSLEDLLASAANIEDESGSASDDLHSSDLKDLLSDMGDDADIAEIGDLLNKEENNELVDESLADFTTADLSEDEIFDGIEELIDNESGKKKPKKKDKKGFGLFGKKKKDKKQKDEAVPETSDTSADADGLPSADELGISLDSDGKQPDGGEDKEIGKKKQGFISKIFAALTDSDDDELDEAVKFEESAVDIAQEGAKDNDKILEELDGEGEEGGKKGKKGKKDKKKKKDDPEKAKKKAEKEKQKADKKAKKAEKAAADAALPKKKLPKKKVIPICILCFSLGIAITLLAFLLPSASDRKKGVEAFESQDYATAYAMLKGNKLNEREQLVYDRTVTLLKEQRKLDSYHNYIVLDMQPEALNALVQGIKNTAELRERADELGVTGEFDSIYNQIVAELERAYGLSIDKVNEWIQIEDPEQYSYVISTFIATGNSDIVSEMEKETPPDDNGITFDDSVLSGEEAELQ